MKVLELYRREIDALDDHIVDLLAERFRIIREVAVVKHKHSIPAVLQDRVEEVQNRVETRANARGIDGKLVRAIYTQLIDASCHLEDQLMAEARRPQITQAK